MKKLLPEWYPDQYILMAMPNSSTDWNYILEDAVGQFKEIIKSLTYCNQEVILLCDNKEKIRQQLQDCNLSRIYFVELPYNDTWTRDYGPLTIEEEGELKALDFGFNGWGLKFAANKDNLVNLNIQNKGLFLQDSYVNNRDFILEGGSIDVNNQGILLTTSRCLCSENRNGGLSKEELTKILKNRLGVKEVVFIDYGYLEGDDTDSHIDTLVRYLPGGKVVYASCKDKEDSQYQELLKMKEQLFALNEKFSFCDELLELSLPDPIYDEEGYRLPATYLNFLISGNYIFVPTYKQKSHDEYALSVIKDACRDYEIVPIDCSVLINQHGSLHCSTMQIPKKLFL